MSLDERRWIEGAAWTESDVAPNNDGCWMKQQWRLDGMGTKVEWKFNKSQTNVERKSNGHRMMDEQTNVRQRHGTTHLQQWWSDDVMLQIYNDGEVSTWCYKFVTMVRRWQSVANLQWWWGNVAELQICNDGEATTRCYKSTMMVSSNAMDVALQICSNGEAMMWHCNFATMATDATL